MYSTRLSTFTSKNRSFAGGKKVKLRKRSLFSDKCRVLVTWYANLDIEVLLVTNAAFYKMIRTLWQHVKQNVESLVVWVYFRRQHCTTIILFLHKIKQNGKGVVMVKLCEMNNSLLFSRPCLRVASSFFFSRLLIKR